MSKEIAFSDSKDFMTSQESQKCNFLLKNIPYAVISLTTLKTVSIGGGYCWQRDDSLKKNWHLCRLIFKC